MRYEWFHRLRRSFASKKGASTVEYVIILAVGVLLASLLYTALSDGSIQQELKNKVIQALNGEQTATNNTKDPSDSENHEVKHPPTNPASSPSAKENEDPGFFQGLWDAGGELLHDTGPWFVDIYEKDVKGVWNDPGGYFLETIGWEGIKDSWNKAWNDPGQYFKDSWDNTVEGWNQFWDHPIKNSVKLVFDWEQFAESWSGKDENGNQIPLLNRVWGVAESLPTPAKAIKVVSIADGIFVHDGCAKKKPKYDESDDSAACKNGNNSSDSDGKQERVEEARDIIAKAKDEDQLINDLIDQNLDESSLYQSLREKYPEETARAITQNILKGNAFNKKMAAKYPYNEIYIEKSSAKSGKVRLDSYNPETGEIVSRKYTQLADIKLETAKNYINELKNKYPPGAKIADVPTQQSGSDHQNAGLAGQDLAIDGQMILEVPVQNKKVPQEILDYAKKRNILIRDENGNVLR